MQFQLSVEGVQKIAEYLVTRPYGEVAHLIEILKGGKGVEGDATVLPDSEAKENAEAKDEPDAPPACGIKQ